MRLSGRDIAEKIYNQLRGRVGELQKKNVTPHLVVFLIGENGASIAYVNQKQRKGEELGCKITVLRFDETVTTEELEQKVRLLNDDPFVHGVLIQRPVPSHIDIDKLELLTNPEKDLDGFHPDSPYTLPLPLAVVKILEEVYKIKLEARNPKSETNTNTQNSNTKTVSNFDIRYSDFSSWLASQNIVVLGKGPTGGGPILAYLKTLQLTPHIIDRKTPNPEKLLKQADIIITATGREHMIKTEALKQGVVLIGVGILKGSDGKLHGDYEEEEIKDIASFYTPTPGGVGPVNVAMLLENLLTATERQTGSQS